MDIMNTATDSLTTGLNDMVMDILPYIFALFLFAGIVEILTPKFRGWMGEKQVSNTLKKLPANDFKIIDNVLLRKSDGSTTQIDHIVVSIFGIFSIETKNYKGIITGGEYSDQWTKHMYKKKYKFQNPIRQNYGHIKALEELLQLPASTFIPIVVFTSDAKLRVKSKKTVINTRDLNKTIRSYETPKLDHNQINDITEKIQNSNIYSKDAMKEHVKSIRRKEQSRKR